MTRSSSSRSKSHKKHSSKDVKERSESEEDVNLKERKGRDEGREGSGRVSSNSEKRKLVSQAVDSKDLVNAGNGDVKEEYLGSKRRKDRSDVSGTDRWTGGSGSLVVDKDMKGEGLRIDSEKALKSKVLVDSRSKSSRRHENVSEKKEENEEKRSSSKAEAKSRSEKDLGRKEVHHYKEGKEKEHSGVDRDRERDRKPQDVRPDRSVERVAGRGVVGSEENRKAGSHSGAAADDRPTKREVGNADWQMHDELRNPELEKELDKRIRRRKDDPEEKDKYLDDVRDANVRRLPSKDDRAKSGRHKDDKNKDEKSKDEKYKDEKYKEEKYKEEKINDGYRDRYQDNLDRDRRGRDEKRRDERSSRDHMSDRSDTRHTREDNKSTEHHKKSKTQNSDRDRLDDRDSRHKDIRGKKRSSEDEDHSDLRLRSSKETRYEFDRKMSSGKVEMLPDRGRSQSRLADTESTVSSSSRRKNSPNSNAHVTKDQYRNSSRHGESKFKDPAPEERVVRNNVTSSRELNTTSGGTDRVSEFRSTEKARSVPKPIHKDENQLADLPADRSPVSDAEPSPKPLKEKSHPSGSVDRRPSNRLPPRRSLDVEDSGRRNFGPKESRDYSSNEERRSQEWSLEKSQADDGSVSMGSFGRNNHLPSGSASLLPPPPPFRTGVDSPSGFGPFDEENRGKSSNRYKRGGDSNVGRGHGNAWKNVPSWPTPVTNGFLFQHGHPSGGFHAMMPQFPASPIFGVRPSMELNPPGVPYHIPDADRFSGHGRPFGWRNPVDETCPPHMHGWDGNNGVFRDESHMHGRPDWDQHRHVMSDRGWETNMELWKGHNNGVNMEFPNVPHKEDNLLHPPMDEVWPGKPGQRSRSDRGRPSSQAESIEIKPDDVSPAQQPIEAASHTIREKTPDNSKVSTDSSAQFCCVYLSKLDVSVDLTHPDLYKKCMSVLDMGGYPADDMTKDIPEECGKAGAKISNALLKATLFPTIKDSVFQKAISLYKQQADEVKVKYPVSSYPGPGSLKPPTAPGEKVDRVPDIAGQKHELVADPDKQKELEPALNFEGEKNCEPDHDKVEELELASKVGGVEESIPASNHEKVEEAKFVQTSDQENREETILHNCEVEEPVPSPGDVIAEEPALSSFHLEEVDAVITSDLERVNEVKDYSPLHASHSIPNSPSIAVIVASEDKEGSSANNAVNKMAFSDTVCGSLGIIDGSEACEAIMPESIECTSVNLSRIHLSPSTH